MLSRLTKVTLSATAGAAAVMLAAGCGASANTSSTQSSGALTPLQALTLAAHRAQQVNSVSFSLNTQVSGATSASVAGTVQIRERPSLLANVNFTTLGSGGNAIPGGMQEIVTTKTVYLKLSVLQQTLGKPWVALPFSELQQATGINLGQLIQQAQQDNPLVQTQMLVGAKNVKAVGTSTVDGVKTTEYTGSFTVASALAKLPASSRSLLEKGMQQLGITGGTFKAWIDAQHLTRKLTVVESGGSERVTVNMQVTSINQPVNPTLPSASQVASIPASALKAPAGVQG